MNLPWPERILEEAPKEGNRDRSAIPGRGFAIVGMVSASPDQAP
jgi:hypothetical protein